LRDLPIIPMRKKESTRRRGKISRGNTVV